MDLSRPETDTKLLYYTNLTTPLGNMFALASDSGLQMLEFHEKEEIASLLSHISKTTGSELKESANDILKNTISQLQEYFDRSRKEFDLPLEPEGSKFQKMVWTQLLTIPYGRTSSYQKQAEALGNVMVIRAMASANGKNPIAIVIPCHRVIGTNGSLTGYAGGLWRKKWLLEHEGAMPKQEQLF
jgi:O-6-methylguanine DNA methyltransferase